MERPDTTCSTRPLITFAPIAVLVRKCTTKAQWGESGASSTAGSGVERAGGGGGLTACLLVGSFMRPRIGSAAVEWERQTVEYPSNIRLISV